MPSKNTYRVGTDGTANYSTLSAIPAEILAQGDTSILVYPGTYEPLTAAVLSDVAFIGVGDREEVVINGDVTIANTSSGTVTFENISLVGSNAVSASATACITKLGAASTPINLKNVIFSNAAIAVAHNAERAFATTAKQIIMNFCDATSVDRAMVSNANASVSYSALNTSANAYFTPTSGNPVVTVTVRASTSGGSNTGNCTETVLALIS